MKFILVLAITLISFCAKAQDTLYVYDTIFIYDTIKIYDTVKVENLNEIRRFEGVSIKNDSTYFVNNDTLTATILKNDIIVNETIKKIEAMKKINLLGVLFVAFQNVTLAQHDFGFELGVAGFGTIDKVKEVSNPISPGFKAGIFYVHNFNERVGLETGIKYLYNINNKRASTSSLDSSILEYKSRFNNEEEETIQNYNLTKYHSQIAIPLLLNVKFNKLIFFSGLEYRYKTYRKSLVYESFISDLGLSSGLKYSLNQRMSLNVLYYNGINREGQISIVDKGNSVDTKLRSYSISTSLAIKF